MTLCVCLACALLFGDVTVVCGAAKGAAWQGRREREREGLCGPAVATYSITMLLACAAACARVRVRVRVRRSTGLCLARSIKSTNCFTSAPKLMAGNVTQLYPTGASNSPNSSTLSRTSWHSDHFFARFLSQILAANHTIPGFASRVKSVVDGP